MSFFDAASRVAASVANGPEGTRDRIFAELGPWISSLTTSAATKWLPALVAEIPCQSPKRAEGQTVLCGAASVASCDVCGKPVCLHHARVDWAGGAICIPCVAAAVKQAREAGPPPGEARTPPRQPATEAAVAKAYKVLGISRNASDDEVRRAYRKLSAKYHPDRNNSSKAAERKFIAVQEAYSVIQQARKAA